MTRKFSHAAFSLCSTLKKIFFNSICDFFYGCKDPQNSTPKTRNIKKSIPRHIISRLLKISKKEKNLKSSHRKKTLLHSEEQRQWWRQISCWKKMQTRRQGKGLCCLWGPEDPLPWPQPQFCFTLVNLSYESSPARSSTSTLHESLHLSVGDQIIYHPNWETTESEREGW